MYIQQETTPISFVCVDTISLLLLSDPLSVLEMLLLSLLPVVIVDLLAVAPIVDLEKLKQFDVNIEFFKLVPEGRTYQTFKA